MGNKNGVPVLRDEDIQHLKKSSGMDENQIKLAFDNFTKEHKNGKMNKTSFTRMLDQALPGQESKKMVPHIFRVYDENKDGYIDFSEFMERSPEEILTRLFKVFDVNGDGFISKSEMAKLVTDMHGLLKAKETDELTADALLKEMDEDKDGKIKLEEYINACLNKDELSKVLTVKIIDIFIDDEEKN